MDDNIIKNNARNNVIDVILIIITSILIIGIIGLMIYFNLIKNDDAIIQENTNFNDDTNNNIMEEKIKYYENENYDIKEQLSFSSSDKKTELILLPPNNEVAAEDNYKNNASYNKNSKSLSLKGETFKNGKYLIFRNNNLEKKGECEKYTSFILNTDNNTIIELNENMYHKVLHINNNYYFTDGNCITGITNIYDEYLRKIGTRYLGHDDKYFYIFDKNIVKYDSTGKIIYKTTDSYKEEDYDSMLYNGVLYIVLNDSDDVYLIDTSDFNRIKIGTTSELSYGGFDFWCFEEPTNGKINLTFHEKGDFTYDPQTKELTKVTK